MRETIARCRFRTWNWTANKIANQAHYRFSLPNTSQAESKWYCRHSLSVWHIFNATILLNRQFFYCILRLMETKYPSRIKQNITIAIMLYFFVKTDIFYISSWKFSDHTSMMLVWSSEFMKTVRGFYSDEPSSVY